MVALRVAESDTDYEAWRQVRIAVEPKERAPTVAELRAADSPVRLLLLAEVDGAVVGSGEADRSNLAGSVSIHPRVLPSARRRGVGTALLRALADHAATLPFQKLASDVDNPGSLAFANRFGFVEVDRQVEQVRAIGTEPPPDVPEGVAILPVAARPALWRAAYTAVGLQAFADMAVSAPMQVPLEEWEREWIAEPEAMFVALSGDEVIGVAGLIRDDDQPTRGENALTAVERGWRGRGVAVALKRTVLTWAAANGISEVYTWTQRGNDAMRRLNEKLGYSTRTESLRVEAPLPLTM